MVKKRNIPWNKGLKGIKTNNKGNSPWNKGIPMKEESKKKLKNSLKGRTSPNKGKKLSKSHKIKLSLSHKGKPNYKNRGEKSNLWMGGISPLHKKIRMSLEYSNWRRAVFERDNYTCQRCKKKGGYLEVHHHKIPFRKIIKNNKIKTIDGAINCPEFWDIDKGITLCVECHIKEDKFRNGCIKK